jgi:hypothetical protein
VASRVSRPLLGRADAVIVQASLVTGCDRKPDANRDGGDQRHRQRIG